jgi:hypothetical protein
MGSLNPFSKPKQDDSALRAQEARLAEQEAKIAADEKAAAEKKNKQQKAALSAQQNQSGPRSLLSGLETGVAPADEKRASLG